MISTATVSPGIRGARLRISIWPSISGASAAKPTAESPADVTALLDRLQDVMTRGVILKEEFEAKKRDLI